MIACEGNVSDVTLISGVIGFLTFPGSMSERAASFDVGKKKREPWGRPSRAPGPWGALGKPWGALGGPGALGPYLPLKVVANIFSNPKQWLFKQTQADTVTNT